MRKLLLTFAFVSTAVLTGCGALPSQTLQLQPEVTIQRQLPNAPIAIQVDDLRNSNVVGDRVDLTGNRAPIIFDNSKAVLGDAVQKALSKTGITTFGPGGHKLTVMLDELNYLAKVDAVKEIVSMNMKLRVKIERHGRSYTGQYGSSRKQEFFSTPSEEENSKLIGSVVEDTLNRAMNDPRLLEFLKFN